MVVEQVALAVPAHALLDVKELVLVVLELVLFHVLEIVRVIVVQAVLFHVLEIVRVIAVQAVLFHVLEIVQVIALVLVLLLVLGTQVVMEAQEVQAHDLDVLEHVLANVQERVLPHALVRAQ